MAVPTWSVGQVLAASDVNNWFTPLAAYKTSATVRNTLTLSTDPDLQVTVSANCVYNVRCAINWSCTTGGIAIQWTVPTGFGGAFMAGYSLSGTGIVVDGYGWGATTAVGASQSSPNLAALIEGTLITGSSGGTFGLLWASAAGPASLSLGAGSSLTLQRVG